MMKIAITGEREPKVQSLECKLCGRYFPDRSKVIHRVHFQQTRKWAGETEAVYSHCYTSQRR